MLFFRRYLPLFFIIFLCIPFVPAHAKEQPIEIQNNLSNLKGYAENMVDAALVHDAKELHKTNIQILQSIKILHNKLDKQAFNEKRSRELVMLYAWMRIISIDINQQTWLGVAIAANQLNASIIQFINYSNLQQRDIAWMDYLSYDLLLLNMESPKDNAELLRVRHTNLKNTWNRISQELIHNFHNKPTVIEGNQLMLDFEKAKNAKQTIHSIKKILIFVDNIKLLARSHR